MFKDYRGATVEDLDIRPALSINPLATVKRATAIAFENEFSHLPVIHENHKKLLGVFSVENARGEHVKDSMLWFSKNGKAKYELETHFGQTPPNLKIMKPTKKSFTVLTPMTLLEDLARFFEKGTYFAIITNGEGNLVYGVVTPDDLKAFEKARPHL